MSGRGRGRGGRGGKQQLTKEQLNSLGVTSNDVLPGPVTQPPPLYPLLNRKPVPLAPSEEYDYLIMLKQDLIDCMQRSGAYLKAPELKSNLPDYEIDKLNNAKLPNAKEKFDWSLFPIELRPKVLAKRVKKTVVKDIDVDSRFIKLEQQEESTANLETGVKVEVEDAEQEEMDLLEEEDEEMDDGTDYANNYFDNGEGYEDEDDNLDDGPIY